MNLKPYYEQFLAETGLTPADVREADYAQMLRTEMGNDRGHWRFVHDVKRSAKQSAKAAAELLLTWYHDAPDYPIYSDLTPERVADSCTRRIGCLWAIMLRRMKADRDVRPTDAR